MAENIQAWVAHQMGDGMVAEDEMEAEHSVVLAVEEHFFVSPTARA